MTVAVYARLSTDRSGHGIGVADQVRISREYAAATWPGEPVSVFEDNDVSASDPNVTRPAFNAMVEAIRLGDLSALVVAEQSRLTRQPIEWEQLMTALTVAGIDGVHTIDNGYVSVSPEHRLIGRIKAAIDAEEVERIKARTRRAHARLRSEGRPVGGRPYGYVPGRDERGQGTYVVDPDAAAVVRRIFEATAAGVPMSRIAAELDADGVPTPRGSATWHPRSLASILRREAVAGLRDGVTASWEPIVPRDLWDAVQEILEQPVRWRSTAGGVGYAPRDRGTRYAYLLAGVAVCGVCGSMLRGNRQQRRSGEVRGAPSYACRGVRGEVGRCGGVSIAAVPLDDTIADDVIRLARDPVVVAAATTDRSGERAALLAEVAAAEATIADMAAEYGAGTIGAAEWRAGREAAHGRLSRARGALAAVPVVTSIDPAEVADTWATRHIGERRRVVAVFIDAVEVAPMRWLRDPAAAPAEWPRDGDGRPLRVVVRWRA